MGKGKVGYSGNVMKAVNAENSYFGRPSSGVKIKDLWKYAKQSSVVKPYQFEQRKMRPYQESPLEKSAYSATPNKDPYQTRIINIADYMRKQQDDAYKKINNVGYSLRTEYKAA